MNNNWDFDPLKGTPNFGIDKLKLHTQLFDVDSTKEWNIVPNRKKAGQDTAEQTPLFGCNGEIVTGEKAYINTDKYSVTINNGRLYAEFNPSKFYHHFDLTADTDKIANVVSFIQKELKETHKTNVDLFSTGIGRLDITAQAQMNCLTTDYKDIISNGKPSMKFKQKEYPNGFLIGNLQRQVCTYDKGLKNQIDNQIKNPQPTNFQRLETRILNSKAIGSHSEFKNLTHLLNGNIKQLYSAYSKSIDDLLTIGQTEIKFIEMDTLTDLIKNTLQQSKKRGQWLLDIVMVLGDNLPNANQFKEALTRLYAQDIISKTHYHRIVKDYKHRLHISQMLKGRYLQQTADSYEERFKDFTQKLILPYKTAQ